MTSLLKALRCPVILLALSALAELCQCHAAEARNVGLPWDSHRHLRIRRPRDIAASPRVPSRYVSPFNNQNHIFAGASVLRTALPVPDGAISSRRTRSSIAA